MIRKNMTENIRNITKDDKVFRFLTYNDPQHESQLSFYGWERSNEHFFFNYIEGYKYAANAIFDTFKVAASNHRIEIQDTVCYPLVFIYRHITELYLKYLYLLLCKPTKDELKSFLKKGHILPELWECLKERMSFLSNRVSYNIDIDAIERYVCEINDNDKDSFCFRYPITKQGQFIHDSPTYLDIDHLKNRMDVFFKYLDVTISKIENQWIDDEYNEDFNLCFKREFKNSLHIIQELFTYLQSNEKPEKKGKTEVWLSLSDIQEQNNENREYEYRFISELTENQKSLFIILYWAGRMLPIQQFAATKDEHIQDIYKLLYNCSNSDVTFDNQSSLYKNNVLRTCLFGSSKTVEYMQKVIKELGVNL